MLAINDKHLPISGFTTDAEHLGQVRVPLDHPAQITVMEHPPKLKPAGINHQLIGGHQCQITALSAKSLGLQAFHDLRHPAAVTASGPVGLMTTPVGIFAGVVGSLRRRALAGGLQRRIRPRINEACCCVRQASRPVGWVNPSDPDALVDCQPEVLQLSRVSCHVARVRVETLAVAIAVIGQLRQQGQHEVGRHASISCCCSIQRRCCSDCSFQ